MYDAKKVQALEKDVKDLKQKAEDIDNWMAEVDPYQFEKKQRNEKVEIDNIKGLSNAQYSRYTGLMQASIETERKLKHVEAELAEAKSAKPLDSASAKVVANHPMAAWIHENVSAKHRPRSTADGYDADHQESLREAFNFDAKMTVHGVGTSGAPFIFTKNQPQATADLTTGADWLDPRVMPDVIVDAMKATGGARSKFWKVNTDDGNLLTVPNNDDNERGTMITSQQNIGGQAKSTDLGSSTFATIADDIQNPGKTEVNARVFTSKFIRVTPEMIKNASFPLVPFIQFKGAQRVTRARNYQAIKGTGALNGTGNDQNPTGLETIASLGARSVANSRVTFQDLRKCIGEIDAAYLDPMMVKAQSALGLNMGKICYLLGRDLELALMDELVGGYWGNSAPSTGARDTRPMWLRHISEGAPGSIFGHEYDTDHEIDNLGADDKWVAFFGNFSHVMDREVDAVAVYPFWDSLTATFNEYWFLAVGYATTRFVGNVRPSSAGAGKAGKAQAIVGVKTAN